MQLKTVVKEKLKPAPPRREVWNMFDRIANRYDFLNHLLSFGQDIVWRRKVSQYLPAKSNLSILDIATGTADQLISLLNCSSKISSAVGIDMAENMLHLAQRKIARRGLEEIISIQEGNVDNLKFEDNCFDVVTIAFGIRNFEDVDKSLTQIHRVLKTKGRLIILEFSIPTNKLFKRLYLFYFRKVLPTIGAIISGDRAAYRYLNETVETFPFGKEFRDILSARGFAETGEASLSWGIATIYYADKF